MHPKLPNEPNPDHVGKRFQYHEKHEKPKDWTSESRAEGLQYENIIRLKLLDEQNQAVAADGHGVEVDAVVALTETDVGCRVVVQDDFVEQDASVWE